MAASPYEYRTYQVYINIIEARNILGVEKDGKSDTYVTANCLRNGKDTQLFKSDPIMLTSHPQWWHDFTAELYHTPSDFKFKLYDWNKVLKDKKIGKAVLSFSAITAAGSYHKLPLGSGKGTLLVFAKVFYSSSTCWPSGVCTGASTRLLFDSAMGATACPDEIMRIGYLIRVKKPLPFESIEFELVQRSHFAVRDLRGNVGEKLDLRKWITTLSLNHPTRLVSNQEKGVADPVNFKHRPYGENFNSLAKTLCTGIHYFQIEFAYPSRDGCGRFIGTGSPEDVCAQLSCRLTTGPNTDFHRSIYDIERKDEAELLLRSDFPRHLKPTLPPLLSTPESRSHAAEDLAWIQHVKITWAVPDEGRNRTSPLPAHLYNPEFVSDEDRQRWFLSPDEDITDAQGQERLYANLYWAFDMKGHSSAHGRRFFDHTLVLSAHTIDDSAAKEHMIGRDVQIDFSLQLVCERFVPSRSDPSSTVRNQLLYTLKTTDKDVGHGKREFKIQRGCNPLTLIYSLPEEMYGHLHTSYVYVQIVATNTLNTKETWVLDRRPFFVESVAPIDEGLTPPSDRPASCKPLEPVPNAGTFRINYFHYPFIDRADDVVADFGEPVGLGPDRLVHLMAPAAAPSGCVLKKLLFGHADESVTLTDALPTPDEAAHFEFVDIGAPTDPYTQHPTMDQPSATMSAEIKETYNFEERQIPATGLFHVGHVHYPFIDRSPEETADFGETPKVGVFGPDRLVRLMAPASSPDGGFVYNKFASSKYGPLCLTESLATPAETEHFEFKHIDVSLYTQDKSIDEPGELLPLKIKTTYTNK